MCTKPLTVDSTIDFLLSRWTDGKVIFASGSPFDPIKAEDGSLITPAQVLVFSHFQTKCSPPRGGLNFHTLCPFHTSQLLSSGKQRVHLPAHRSRGLDGRLAYHPG